MVEQIPLQSLSSSQLPTSPVSSVTNYSTITNIPNEDFELKQAELDKELKEELSHWKEMNESTSTVSLNESEYINIPFEISTIEKNKLTVYSSFPLQSMSQLSICNQNNNTQLLSFQIFLLDSEGYLQLVSPIQQEEQFIIIGSIDDQSLFIISKEQFSQYMTTKYITTWQLEYQNTNYYCIKNRNDSNGIFYMDFNEELQTICIQSKRTCLFSIEKVKLKEIFITSINETISKKQIKSIPFYLYTVMNSNSILYLDSNDTNTLLQKGRIYDTQYQLFVFHNHYIECVWDHNYCITLDNNQIQIRKKENHLYTLQQWNIYFANYSDTIIIALKNKPYMVIQVSNNNNTLQLQYLNTNISTNRNQQWNMLYTPI